jgi:hypothetical protein
VFYEEGEIIICGKLFILIEKPKGGEKKRSLSDATFFTWMRLGKQMPLLMSGYPSIYLNVNFMTSTKTE